MRIRLTPYYYDYLKVHWQIDGDNYYFLASCVMESQFSAFLSSVYSLYEEEDICTLNTIKTSHTTIHTIVKINDISLRPKFFGMEKDHFTKSPL